jgi:hypothetical protein
MVIIGDVFLVIIMVELTLENGGTGLVAPHITLSVKHRTKEVQIIHTAGTVNDVLVGPCSKNRLNLSFFKYGRLENKEIYI